MRLQKISLVLTALCLFTFFPIISAQVSSPVEWQQFVKDPVRNVLVRDTFLFQSFEDGEIGWEYSSMNEKVLGFMNADKTQITGQGGQRSLILKHDMGVLFKVNPQDIYSDVTVSVNISGGNFKRGDSLELSYRLQNGTKETYNYFQTEKEISRIHYRDSLSYKDEVRSNPMILADNPVEFSLFFNSFDNAFVGLDSALVYGSIPEYSLFRESGKWQDTICWSHLPAARHRRAMINGDVLVEDSIHSQEIHLGRGGIQINKKGKLTTNRLIFYEDSFYLVNHGQILSKNGVTFEKTFPTKGEWYFVSFPCDIYKKDIDPGFSLKDETPNQGGDYFYLLTYDGDKRSQSNSSKGNWLVVPEDFPDNQPLFEKGKGYLLALDKKASRQTISFSSKNYLNRESGQQPASIAITVPTKQPDTNEENHGWYLCGNPFPAPLSFSQFVSNDALDGYIYVYNGSGYKAYSIEENYQLPPYSTFFVKAKSSTSLIINPYITDIPEQTLLKSYAMEVGNQEPVNSEIPTSSLQSGERSHFYTIQSNRLYIHKTDLQGEIRIIDMKGRSHFQKEIKPDISVYDLNLPKGIYLINILSATNQFQDKFIINQ